MKKVEIRRHALKGTGEYKEMLSPEGIAQAEKVGETMRGKGYTHIATTPYFRTAQTACGFAKGAGDFTAVNHATLDALFTKELPALVEYVKEHGAVVKPDHPLIRAEAARMSNEFGEWLATLPEGAHVLAVGHSPLLEILIYGLSNQVLEPLKECEGASITYQDGHKLLTEHFRF